MAGRKEKIRRFEKLIGAGGGGGAGLCNVDLAQVVRRIEKEEQNGRLVTGSGLWLSA